MQKTKQKNHDKNKRLETLSTSFRFIRIIFCVRFTRTKSLKIIIISLIQLNKITNKISIINFTSTKYIIVAIFSI